MPGSSWCSLQGAGQQVGRRREGGGGGGIGWQRGGAASAGGAPLEAGPRGWRELLPARAGGVAPAGACCCCRGWAPAGAVPAGTSQGGRSPRPMRPRPGPPRAPPAPTPRQAGAVGAHGSRGTVREALASVRPAVEEGQDRRTASRQAAASADSAGAARQSMVRRQQGCSVKQIGKTEGSSRAATLELGSPGVGCSD